MHWKTGAQVPSYRCRRFLFPCQQSKFAYTLIILLDIELYVVLLPEESNQKPSAALKITVKKEIVKVQECSLLFIASCWQIAVAKVQLWSGSRGSCHSRVKHHSGKIFAEILVYHQQITKLPKNIFQSAMLHVNDKLELLSINIEHGLNWSCHSVYRRQDLCVAKTVLWIFTSCTYWWENRHPYHPLLHDGTPPPPVDWWPSYHSWLMTLIP